MRLVDAANLITNLNDVDLLPVRLQRRRGRHRLFLDGFLGGDHRRDVSGGPRRLHGLLGLALHHLLDDGHAAPLLPAGAHGNGGGGGDALAVEAGLPGVERKQAAEGAAAEKVLTDATDGGGEDLGGNQLTRISYSLFGELNKNKLKVSWSPSSVVGNKLNEKLMLS